MGLHEGAIIIGIRGRYRIEDELGRGGLGVVWRGTDLNNGTTVAIKEPLDQGPNVQMNFDKLRVEARVLERLTGYPPLMLSQNGYSVDPTVKGHIVRFLDVDRVNEPNLLVLEYVEGKSMDREFRATSPSDFGFIDNYARTILNVVKALHQNNVLHRDISPHNLLSTPNASKDPTLIDFGTAKEGFNQLTDPHWTVIIKAGYSAPELVKGVATPSSDLYSVAATLLFMYTGVNPQYLRDRNGDLDKRKSQIQRLPRNKLEFIEKALSDNPAYRFQTADDMLIALTGGQPALVSAPNIVASGKRIVIQQQLVLGRSHPKCDGECRKKGFSVSPDIAINDSERYIGRHHAMIRLGQNGECFIQDLHSLSGTAIRHASGTSFEVLQSGREYRLLDGDIIALAYSSSRGPYMTVSYHTR
jgi:serine/threonine protein kinase